MDITDNKRICKILDILSNSKKAVSGENIAVELGITSRTVRSDIRKLSEYLKDNGARVVSTTGVGYYLEIDNKSKFDSLIKDISISSNLENSKPFNLIPTDSDDRSKYIISKLLINSLGSRDIINPYDLSEELFISLSTLKKDISSINYQLSKFNLKVEISQTKGIFIKGKECDIRYCIADYIFSNKEIINIEDVEFYSEIFSKELLETIKNILIDVFSKFDIHLTDISFKNILVHILIMVKRDKYNQTVLFDYETIDELNKSEKFMVASEIISRIKKSIGVDLEEEIYYLTQHLLSSKKFSYKENEIYSEYSESINKILTYIKDEIGVNLFDDKQLKNGLAMHLDVALKRMKFNMNIRNDFLDSIKNSYPLAFELGIITSRVLEEEYGVKVNENEIGLLAIHFGAALERVGIDSKENIKNITIVCGFGVSTAILIKEKILRFFEKKVNILNITSLQDFNKDMLDNSDVVITTVPIRKFKSNKIIQVPLNIGFNHLQQIEDILLEGQKNEVNYKEILKEELYFKKLNANSKNEVIDIITNKMIELGYIDEVGKESVYDREKMATTELGSLVALPHTIDLKNNISAVGIAVLEKPIIWDKEKVQVVLLLNISKSFISEWELIFRNLYDYLISKSKVTKLVKGMSYKTFINELIENSYEQINN